MKIKYSELKNIILENNFHGKNLIVEGTGGSGKTTLAQEKYINMIEKEKLKVKILWYLYLILIRRWTGQ